MRKTATLGRDAQSTVATQRHDPAKFASATFRLVAERGPDVGKSLTLDGSEPGPTLIGQGPACELLLSDRQVSRRHAAVELIEGRLHIVDLGSTNGTRINGIAVVDAYLSGGESIAVGGTSLRVELISSNTVTDVSAASAFERVVGASVEMRRLYPLCERMSATNVPVIIEGETGTGKEMLAEALHEHGPRASKPFVVFDCTAVPPNLVESDLFGHERGAFTGAVGVRKGVFEQAHGGTLLIDEIGDLQPELQPKLLRALERSEIRRVGGDHPIKVDVRVLSATRRDLDREVQAGRFRDDLFHRLAVLRIELPPLRRRRGDIPLLVQALCRQLGGDPSAIPERLLRRWEDDAWPGNVRELRNAVARYLAVGELSVESSESDARGEPATGAPAGAEGALEHILGLHLPFSTARTRVIDEFERRYVEAILKEHGGNVMRAAAASGIARRHLQRVKARMPR